MLQQILRDMYVDPEILAELDEDQKQVLFCKMREEQVRRWRLWDKEQKPVTNPRPGKKKNVDFLLGEDGEPWVWVMGEHPGDKSIEEILEEEAKEAARSQALQETHQLRLTVQARLDSLIDENKKLDSEEGGGNSSDSSLVEDMYCSVDEINTRPVVIGSYAESNQAKNMLNRNKRDALQEISFNKPKNVLQRVAQWEKRVMDERTCEIYKQIQRRKQEVDKEEEEAHMKHEEMWREREKKAKEAEMAKREIARRAREEYRRTVIEANDTPPALPPRAPSLTAVNRLEVPASKPPSKDAILEWFKSSQFTRRAGLEPGSNTVAPWFHGLISRTEAEHLLKDKPLGSFLVRISERIWGYAISYRDNDRCKHYLIDASNGHYQFLGSNQISHNTLYDLVHYHGAKPITAVGGELLGSPCHRNEPLPAIFQGLIRAR